MNSRDLLAAVLKTLTRTYKESDPRARARRFYPLFAKLGYITMTLLLVSGAVFLLVTPFFAQTLACMVYGIFIFPIWGIGTFAISQTLYLATVLVLRFKDHLTR